MDKVKQQSKMPMASEAGQMPPTDANPTRQRYQMACGGGGDMGASTSRQRTYSRQFNRGSTRSRGGY